VPSAKRVVFGLELNIDTVGVGIMFEGLSPRRLGGACFVVHTDDEVNGAGFVPPLSHQRTQNRQDLQGLQGGQGQFS
jgi:hypothetical protein